MSFEARPGELVGLVGRSGSGKTTLFNVIAGWERPTSGEVRWREAVDASSPSWYAVAVVPQKLGLMEELTVEENIEYPARLAGTLDERSDAIEELIGVLGIGELRSRYPREASVGEQQRTAIARAPWRCRPACCSRTSPRRTRTRRRRSECSPRSAAPPTRERRSSSRPTTRR